MRPRFNSTRYGSPTYCQLADDCADEITRGADDESEMGAFHDLFQPQRDGESARAARRVHAGRHGSGLFDWVEIGAAPVLLAEAEKRVIMKGDFTRDTFDRAKHFSRVLMQQGRVQLDADWNEQTSILLHYLRTLAGDILGPSRGRRTPWDSISSAEGRLPMRRLMPSNRTPLGRRSSNRRSRAATFVIGTGRYYVHGVLVENERAILYTSNSAIPTPKKPGWKISRANS